MPVVNMVFGSFNLHREFLQGAPVTLLANIVRVLVYNRAEIQLLRRSRHGHGQQVLREQVAKSALQLEHSKNISTQQRLNFECPSRGLYQSFEDRERVSEDPRAAQPVHELLVSTMN